MFTSSAGNQDDQEEIDDDPDAGDDDETDEDLNDSTITWSTNHQPASSKSYFRHLHQSIDRHCDQFAINLRLCICSVPPFFHSSPLGHITVC
ncbi:hypothetical protein BT96DRAFT_992136 [Gymnopus androsaceus JB14]|uniref:Uncharacterized protein n=1 Tax=Gymnopus androsaceus JB14 TaxID=1447944 RepID=A0A6A4HTC5_9AGAR|nr:hypothetical protein BT96DRAFT_992136 [Gymnopus androsaceus JB14]